MKLCVISDIHSQPMPSNCLSNKLPKVSEITRLTLCELSGEPYLEGEALHHHLFAEGGMDKAVRNLMSHWEKDHWGLGYSAGGTVLWKAAARGHAFAGIFCVSSTRLRNEGAIETPHHIFFGNKDPNKPASEWLSIVPKQYTLLNGAGHNYYLDAHSTATELTCKAMARQISAL